MKKITCLLLSAVVIIASFFSFCITSYASQTDSISKTRLGTSDTYYEFNAQTKTLIISGAGDTPDFTNTSMPWFEWRSDGSIEKVVVQEGVTSLGNFLFNQVSAFEISLPSTLTKIASNALAYTVNVKSYDLYFGLKSIGSSAFLGCTSLENITIPKTVTSIGSKAFQNCTSLTEILIPYNVATVASYAFSGCTSLRSARFQSLTSSVSIGNNVFMGCSFLKYLEIPMNAKCGVHIFGYKDSSTKYTDVSLGVFSSSNGAVYAQGNSIDYVVLDTIAMECAVEYRHTYDDSNVSKTYQFVFTADSDAVYNFYSQGDCDVTAVLKDSSNNIIDENDDIDDMTDRNFCISASLKKGEVYNLFVSSVKSAGDTCIVVYPDIINSFDIKGSLSFLASQGQQKDDYLHFDINDNMLSDFVLTVHFGTGLDDMMYYKTGYFDKRDIKAIDNQDTEHFICGENTAQLAVGDITQDYSVFVEHSYTETIAEPTVDDDGYTLHTCILCDYSYKDNFVETTAVTVSGKAVLMESPDGSHSNNIPYLNAEFYINDRIYTVDNDGSWSFNTFDDCDVIFSNEYGADITVHFDVESDDMNYGYIAFVGFDYNKDGKVNVKDFAIYLDKSKFGSIKNDYWQYAENFF